MSMSMLQVADAYFRAGADKVSIGTDAVEAARAWLRDGVADGSTSIEQISRVYGRQASDVLVPSIAVRRRAVHTCAHRCHVAGARIQGMQRRLRAAKAGPSEAQQQKGRRVRLVLATVAKGCRVRLVLALRHRARR